LGIYRKPSGGKCSYDIDAIQYVYIIFIIFLFLLIIITIILDKN
jgi:hypothetical protein